MSLAAFNAERRKGPVIGMLLAVLLGYGPVPGTLGYFLVADWRRGGPPPPVGPAVVGLLLLGLGLLLFYAVPGAFRFTLADDGVHVRTWRGRRFFPWAGVRRAAMKLRKNDVVLVLRFGRRRVVRLSLGGYRRSRALLEELRGRLPVPVEVADGQAPLVDARLTT